MVALPGGGVVDLVDVVGVQLPQVKARVLAQGPLLVVPGGQGVRLCSWMALGVQGVVRVLLLLLRAVVLHRSAPLSAWRLIVAAEVRRDLSKGEMAINRGIVVTACICPSGREMSASEHSAPAYTYRRLLQLLARVRPDDVGLLNLVLPDASSIRRRSRAPSLETPVRRFPLDRRFRHHRRARHSGGVDVGHFKLDRRRLRLLALFAPAFLCTLMVLLLLLKAL